MEDREDDLFIAGRCGSAASHKTYKAGCRCEDCRAWQATDRRERRHRNVEQERATNREWRLRRRIEKVAVGYLIDGADENDAKQIAMIAVEEAKANFDAELGVPFEAFAVDVAKRRLSDAQTAAGRQKHRVLTTAMREGEIEPGETLELLPDRAPDPYEVVVHRIELRAIIAALPMLTELERIALRWVLNGESYAGSREVDNAIQRARRKLRLVANAA